VTLGLARNVASWLRRTPFHPQWLLGTHKKSLRHLKELPPGRILDIGCADRWVEAQLPAQCEYIGLDYYATGKYLYRARPDLFADAAALPLPDACIDVVVMLEVLEHLFLPGKALHEIARVLRPGGRLLLSVPFLYPVHDAPFDFQRYTVHGLTRELEFSGLRLEQVESSLGSAQTAGLIGSLALGGMAMQAWRRRRAAVVLIPAVCLMIPLVNLLAWLGGKLLPDWPAITAGYHVVASKQ
jgi:SAM-dependent methyltransferase